MWVWFEKSSIMTIRNVTRHWNLQRRHWTVSFFIEVKYIVLVLPSVIAHSLLSLLTIAALLLLQLNFRCILPWLLGDRQINKPENVFKFFCELFPVNFRVNKSIIVVIVSWLFSSKMQDKASDEYKASNLKNGENGENENNDQIEVCSEQIV